MLRTFIQVTGLILTLEAAIFLAKGNLGLSAGAIAQLSSAKWDYNADLIQNLAQQRADTWVGVLLLLLAFALQMGNALWEMRFDDDIVHRGAVAYGVVFCAVIAFGAFFLSREIASTTEARVKSIFAMEVARPASATEQNDQGKPNQTMEPTR